jgi:uncharacterized membrane protein YgcG
MNPLAIPKLQKYINDFSWILSPEQIEILSQDFISHESATTEQVVTIFIPHREWNELLEIWLKVFNENGIGQKDLNNGLLLIIATEEKKLRIIVGKWLELKYTEMVCRDIIENQLRPLLNESKYEELMQEWGKIATGRMVIIHEENIWGINQYENNLQKRRTIQNTIIYISFLFIVFCIISILYPIFWEVLLWILWVIAWFIWISSGIYFFKKDSNETNWTKILVILIIFGLTLIPLNYWIQQTYCQFNKSVACSIWNTPHIYSTYGWWSNWNSYNNSSSSDWSSSNSSSSYDSSSSFDGGGGSSNWGGYGD